VVSRLGGSAGGRGGGAGAGVGGGSWVGGGRGGGGGGGGGGVGGGGWGGGAGVGGGGGGGGGGMPLPPGRRHHEQGQCFKDSTDQSGHRRRCITAATVSAPSRAASYPPGRMMIRRE